MTKQKGICEECETKYEYEYNPKYPRKYCLDCSAKKKQDYEDNNIPTEKPVAVPNKDIPISIPNKNTTMYVSYAKDIVVAQLMTHKNLENTNIHVMMKTAIDLVKQAIKEFS